MDPGPGGFRRIAIVHDWLTGMRGGERVLLELCRLFPEAEVHTLLWNRGSVHPEIEARVRSESFLGRLPGSARGYRNYLPLFPSAVRSLELGDADLVISSSHAVAKGVRVPAGAVHVSYVHTPMRYLWDETDSYFRFVGHAEWKRLALQAVKPYLRRFDLRTVAGVDHFVANSETVAGRIRRYYGRRAEVVHPPVDTDFFTADASVERGEDYLIVSSLEPYKRVDIAIRAFNESGKRMTIVGSGTQLEGLRKIAAPNVRFAGRVSDDEVHRHYQSARALIFPGLEDFGMTPVEAQACGCPVICYGVGGATESVIDGETGLYFAEQVPESLTATVDLFEHREWDSGRCRENSLRFSRQVFVERFSRHIAESEDRGARRSGSAPPATP